MSQTPGLSEYNLYGIKLQKAGFRAKDSLQYMAPTYVKGIDGDLITVYKHIGMSYYNLPFFWKGPMLPAVIKWSHHAFLGKDKPFFVLQSNIREAVYKVKPKAVFRSQFWLAIIPIFFNLFLALIVYHLCRCFAGIHASLLAVSALVFFPVSLLCSYRLWNESLAMTFLWSAILLYWKSMRFSGEGDKIARDRTGVLLLIISGVCFGFAVLSNQRTLSFLPGLWAFGIFCNGYAPVQTTWKKLKTWAHPEFCVFALSMLLVTFFWFYKVTVYYGNPLWMPVETVTLWTKELQARPIAPIVYILGGIYLCPILLLGFGTATAFIKDAVRVFKGDSICSPFIFLWILGVPLMAYLFILRHDNPEHRYFYPIIPAFIVLSAMNLERLNRHLSKYFKSAVVLMGLEWGIMIGYSYWAFHTAMPVILNQKNLIRIPF
ncbi:MAG: hypothetical protein KC649_01445 [Candidatus Omnitrophica bacterium]|nr:hypothetical protein [Candidatus Omnitrophota bacterium]